MLRNKFRGRYRVLRSKTQQGKFSNAAEQVPRALLSFSAQNSTRKIFKCYGTSSAGAIEFFCAKLSKENFQMLRNKFRGRY
ncbi:MAG: hypothetical protein SOV73_07300, partial [Candidatus Faecivivens sp.]|nr:hypothetical protein [Candidatus Faecivivens sp.]